MNFHSILRQLPFVKIAITYALAIILVYYYPGLARYFQLFSLIVAGGLIISFFIFKSVQRFLFGLLIYVFLFYLGLLNTMSVLKFQELPAGKLMYSALINRVVENKSDEISLTAVLKSIRQDNQSIEIDGQLEIKLEPNTDSLLLLPGDSLFFEARIFEISNSGNPNEFNYKAYRALEGIHYHVHIKSDEYRVVVNKGKFPIRRLAKMAADRLISILEHTGIQGNELAVLVALTIGDRSNLNPELLNAYAGSGVMHVLSVSGLHVGILFLFLNFILWPFNNTPAIRILRFSIILIFIWGYAIITGLSPSVARAALMFTLIQIAKTSSRPFNIYNILAASAFILFVIDPLVIFKPGLQLSYLALLGIIFFQPRISGIFIFPNRIIQSVWELFTVGFAAQITTLPLTLFYFHQFPVYFWLTNLFVVPLVWLIMIASLFVIVFSAIPFIACYLSKLLNYLLVVQNSIIELSLQLPGSQITAIPFSKFELILWFIGLLLGILLIAQLKFKQLIIIVLIVIMVNIGYRFYKYQNQLNQTELVVYNDYEFDLTSIIQGHHHNILYSGSDSINKSRICKKYASFWMEKGVNNNINWLNLDLIMGLQEIKNTEPVSPTIFTIQPFSNGANGVIIEYLANKVKQSFASTSGKTRILVFDRTIDTESLSTVNFNNLQQVVISGSIEYDVRKSIIETCRKYQIPLHDLKTQGAFRLCGL